VVTIGGCDSGRSTRSTEWITVFAIGCVASAGRLRWSLVEADCLVRISGTVLISLQWAHDRRRAVMSTRCSRPFYLYSCSFSSLQTPFMQRDARECFHEVWKPLGLQQHCVNVFTMNGWVSSQCALTVRFQSAALAHHGPSLVMVSAWDARAATLQKHHRPRRVGEAGGLERGEESWRGESELDGCLSGAPRSVLVSCSLHCHLREKAACVCRMRGNPDTFSPRPKKAV